MSTCKSSFVFLSCVALLGFEHGVALALEYKLSAKSIKPGERATLEVRLPVRPEERGKEAEPPFINDDLLTQAPQVILLERDFYREEDEWVWHYEVTGYRPGRIAIPPVEIRMGGESLSTERVDIEIAEVRKEDDLELRPETGLLSPPIPWATWLWRFALFAAAAAAFFFGDRYLKKRFKKKPVVIEPRATAPVESPEAWLRRQLQRIRHQMETQERKPFVDELTHVLREYFAKRRSQAVEAWTTSEMRQRLGDDAGATALFPLFDECDRVKFTGRNEDDHLVARKTLEESEKNLLHVAASGA